MNVVENLTAAKNVISDPKHWITGTTKKVIDGETCYCSMGALSILKFPAEYMEAYEYLVKVMGFVAEFNDSHTHDEVMLAWDKAIELAKTEGK